jgi:hypothetical protein
MRPCYLPEGKPERSVRGKGCRGQMGMRLQRYLCLGVMLCKPWGNRLGGSRSKAGNRQASGVLIFSLNLYSLTAKTRK